MSESAEIRVLLEKINQINEAEYNTGRALRKLILIAKQIVDQEQKKYATILKNRKNNNIDPTKLVQLRQDVAFDGVNYPLIIIVSDRLRKNDHEQILKSFTDNIKQYMDTDITSGPITLSNGTQLKLNTVDSEYWIGYGIQEIK